MMITARLIAAAAVVTAIAAHAHAQTRNLTADVSGANENPPTGSPATGQVEGVYDFLTNTFAFSWSITDDLVGMPGPPGAHIHRGVPGMNGPVAFGFAHGDGTWELMGEAVWTNISPADVELLLNGGLYINFHTSAHPSGEIRGQLVPSPGAIALMCVAGLTMSRRRR